MVGGKGKDKEEKRILISNISQTMDACEMSSLHFPSNNTTVLAVTLSCGGYSPTRTDVHALGIEA